MLTTTLHTFIELDKWLSDNYYFEDGHILTISENPIEITIGYNVKANYQANSERHILPFKIIPEKIIEWTYEKDIINTGDDNYIDGIDAVEIEQNICLEFSTPTIFRLTTNKLTVEEQPLIRTVFEPWASDREMFLTADFNEIPKPDFWQQRLKQLGHNVSYRYMYSEEVSTEKVPYPDYQGYFLQLADRVNITTEGIFLKHLNVDNGRLSLGFENKDDVLKGVWDDLTRILSDFPNATINSGNCTFTGGQWKQFLKDKILPTAK